MAQDGELALPVAWGADDLEVRVAGEEGARGADELGRPTQSGEIDGWDTAILDGARDQSDRLMADGSNGDQQQTRMRETLQ